MSKKSKNKKTVKKQRNETAWKNHLILKEIEPLTVNQCKVFEEYERGKNVVMHGSAGTGKSFIALYLALKELESDGNYQRVIIFRSAVNTRDQGFLPGNLKEKSEVYEFPYYQLCSKLYGRDDAYPLLKQKNIIEFMTTSYTRGFTLDNAIVIVDEFQNCVSSELNSLITRLGTNSKLIICGDITQNDLKKGDKTAVREYINIFKNMSSISIIEFGIEDVVRSGFCKEYLLARYKLEMIEAIPMLGD